MQRFKFYIVTTVLIQPKVINERVDDFCRHEAVDSGIMLLDFHMLQQKFDWVKLTFPQ